MQIQSVEAFQNKLLEWYDHSARVLPWRNNPSPYRVWISEIMLQQTRVDTVKPYFENFMKVVPDVQKLSEIEDNQLLKLWEGLGYYSRAKNLKKAAKMILLEFGGELPSNYEELLLLSGIGPYTAGAIASIAYGKRVAAVDGNVFRVIARLTANREDITNPSVKKEIEEQVRNLLPMERNGDFNQALMELGATICLPNGEPKCENCPVSTLCEGYELDIAGVIPVKSKKKDRRMEYKTVLVMECEGKYAIRQRAHQGLLSSLWEFPNIDGQLSQDELEDRLKEGGIQPRKIEPLAPSKHIFTHLEWHMSGYYVQLEDIPEDDDLSWISPKEMIEQYSIPTAFRAYHKFISHKK